MEREVKLVSAWEGRAHENFSELLEEEVEKQLGESDKYEIKPISESLKEKVVDIVKLQEVLLEVFQNKVL
jgi:hypothetical protein